MSSPEPGGRSRPLRVAGLALLGVAVGALLVGLVTIGGGNGGNGGDSAGPTSTSPATDTTTADGTQTTDGTATTSIPVGTTPSPTAAPAPTTAQPPPPPPPEPKAPIRVYNNSTITGLAAQAAEDFRRAGWQVDEVANFRGLIPTSTVYFRPGTDEEAAARALANRFNLRVEPRFDGIAGAKPGLIVIVTNDYGSK